MHASLKQINSFSMIPVATKGYLFASILPHISFQAK